MIRDIAVGVRYGWSWLTGRADVSVSAVELDRGDRRVPASLFLPTAKRRDPLPAWVLLHGATVTGREHPQLVRFARTVAHTGAAVIVPEVPEWKALSLAPALTRPTVEAAIPRLREVRGVGDRPIGLVGFSFGAPHAVVAAGDPALAGSLAGVAAFGGYCDLPRTMRYLFHGENEWEGERFHSTPDAYGRWIVCGNYLRSVPGLEDARDVCEALIELATTAGDWGKPATDPTYDPLKRELAERVAPERRTLFETIATLGDTLPDREASEALIARLVPTIRRVDPAMDPEEGLRRVRLPVRLVHGLGDVLIPYTETLRMAEHLTGSSDLRVTITPAFAHTREERGTGVGLTSGLSLVRTLGQVLRLV